MTKEEKHYNIKKGRQKNDDLSLEKGGKKNAECNIHIKVQR